jgi:hypothetical protein
VAEVAVQPLVGGVGALVDACDRLFPEARERSYCAASRSAAVGSRAAVFLAEVFFAAVFLLPAPVEPLNFPPLSRLTRRFIGAAGRGGAARGVGTPVVLAGRGIPVIERGASGPAVARRRRASARRRADLVCQA